MALSIGQFTKRRGKGQVQDEPSSYKQGKHYNHHSAFVPLGTWSGHSHSGPQRLGGQRRGSAGLMWPLAGQLCAQLLSYLMEDGKDGFGGTAGCLCLLASVSSSIKWI